jgi:hypothetical protein
MVKTSAATAEFLRGLTTQVKNGSLTKEEAKKKAIKALQEVAEKEIEPEVAESEEEAPVEQAPAPTPPSVDPKTKILSLLTRFEETVQVSLKKLETEITNIVKETEGAAVPLGDFTIGNDATHKTGNNASAKITIAAGEKPAQAQVTYLLKKSWTVDGINLPVTASVTPACNLPLRHELLMLCADVREGTGSELAWKRNKKLPLEQLSHLESLAKASGDSRVAEILEGKPSDALADSWKKWATAGQVYLLGSDWSEDKKFSAVKQGL